MSLTPVAVRATTTSELPQDSGEIHLELKKLQVLGRVLHVAAHPDDENTRLMAYWANGALYETGYLSLTRGDGGQNLVGPELREQLGLIRSQELLAARGIDGGRQFFTRAVDFGYSKTAEETMRIWDGEAVIGDTVWVIRRFRPDVIVTRFGPDGGRTHGHHTASARIALAAFKAAGDPTQYPEQLAWVEPWQPRRIVWNNWRRSSAAGDADSSSPETAVTEVGGYNPLLGKSFGEIAAASRSMHKSQGFGSGASRGNATERFILLAGEPMEDDLFDGVDTTWTRVAGADGDSWARHLTEIEAAFRSDDPAASVPALLELRRKLRSYNGNDPWVSEKRRDLDAVILACLGLHAEARSEEVAAVPGEAVAVDLRMIRRQGAPVRLSSLRVPFAEAARTVGIDLPLNEEVRHPVVVTIPVNAPTSEPYWLRTAPGLGMFSVDDPRQVGDAGNPPALEITTVLEVLGEELELRIPVERVTVDPVRGEIHTAIQIIPRVLVELASSIYLFDSEAPRPVTVRTDGQGAPFSGELRLELPPGWSASPVSRKISSSGEAVETTFALSPPAGSATGRVRAVLTTESDTYSRGLVRIAYDHLPTQWLLPEAEARLARVSLKRGATRIGYLPGAGDSIAENLRTVGLAVELLDPDMVEADLSGYEAIVVGIRAYNTVATIDAWMPRLFAFVKQGGTVLVQYNTSHRLKTERLAPFPLELSRDRVTEEQAPVSLLAPGHPAMTYPNRITEADFDGWVQERGLYFPDSWDAAFTPLLSAHDQGEAELEGGLLVAPFGDGWFVYTGYSFFRQLPAGVPGAYRLFLNLLSLSQSDDSD